MAMAKYDLTPVAVPPVKSRYRRIRTRLPVPESLPVFQALQASEPQSMMGQPPIVWDRAEGFQVWDRWGNVWIDWSSGVLITNTGHGRGEIRRALQEALRKPLLSTYVFVHEKRAELTRALQALAPDPTGYQVFLLSTGSEAIENAIKLARTYALKKHGSRRRVIVSFQNAFHGRTLGAQLAGGMPALKEWIVGEGQTFVQVPFPDGYKNEDTSFELFLKSLRKLKVRPREIAGVITESYQGVGPDFMPMEYARELERFCREEDIVTVFDEVQAGFGRTGAMFCFEHYGIRPDLIVCGKGISSSLPLSAVIGRADIMALYPPGSMTSTHSASPLPVVAALANLRILERENLVENARRMGEILLPGLARIQQRYPERLGCLHGKGLVAGIQAVRPGGKSPDPQTALAINLKCFHKGLLMFAPVGVGGECVKIAPPLVIGEEPLRESIEVFEEACREVCGR
jgi:4-aminobutyrate aminotransferase/(S)-3-amino-2-methylpropionate transaminase